MTFNKFLLQSSEGNQVLLDLTEDTVTSETLALGETAHDKSGNLILGTLVADPSPTTLFAEKIIFPDGVKTTYNFGKIQPKNQQMEEIIPPGGNLKQIFEALVEEINPATTPPSATISLVEAGSYEVGTSITPTYVYNFSNGSYSYDDDTGVVENSCTITDTNGNNSPFSEFIIEDNTNYKVNVTIAHSDGIVPQTNLGNLYTEGQIKAGEVTATSKAITGYRDSFYGTTIDKNAITSATLRSLKKSGKALSNGFSFTMTIPVGAMRVIFAYPATLRDVTSIKDINGMQAEISSSFVKQILAVEGANNYTSIDYKVYTLDFAIANDKANSYMITI